MESTEIYRGKALMPKSAKDVFLSLLYIALFCCFIFLLSSRLPFAWFFEIVVVLLGAIQINKTLKKGTFTITYILYDKSLVELTRYGLIEKETAVFRLDECDFYENSICKGGKIYPFYPDEKLKMLLKTKTSS